MQEKSPPQNTEGMGFHGGYPMVMETVLLVMELP